MRAIRGSRIAMVFQEPMTSLNPVFTIGDQIGEAIALHEGGSKKSVRDRIVEGLRRVGISSPERRADSYPHELSGGMRQRAMIAMALACTPSVLIADEPTTALDVTIQAQILELLKRLQRELGMAMILVTHDFGVVANLAKRVIVMYAGQFVEEGSVEEIFANPMHPYTQGLLRSIPPLIRTTAGTRLPTIPGRVPNLANLPRGCYFADRCPKAVERCRNEAVPDDPCNVGRLVRCFFAGR
jgi:oligopeptide/dipeptide ABC transporter ATP-binding protein